MFCVCVGRAGLPSMMLVSSERLLCLCTVGMHARCSGSVTRDTGVDYLNLYHLDWSTPQGCVHRGGETRMGDGRPPWFCLEYTLHRVYSQPGAVTPSDSPAREGSPLLIPPHAGEGFHIIIERRASRLPPLVNAPPCTSPRLTDLRQWVLYNFVRPFGPKTKRKRR